MSACSGGQIVVPLPLAQKLVQQLTGLPLIGFPQSPEMMPHPSRLSDPRLSDSSVSADGAVHLLAEQLDSAGDLGVPSREVPPIGMQVLTLGSTVLTQWPVFGQHCAQKVPGRRSLMEGTSPAAFRVRLL